MSKQTQLGENQCHLLPMKTRLYSEKQEQSLEQILSTSHTQLHYSMPDSSLIPCPTGSWGTVELWLFHNIFSLLLFLLTLLQHGLHPQTAVFWDKPVPVWSLQGLQGNPCSSTRRSLPSSLPSLPSLFPYLGFYRAVSHIFSSHLSLLHGFLNICPQMYTTLAEGLRCPPSCALFGASRNQCFIGVTLQHLGTCILYTGNGTFKNRSLMDKIVICV